MDQGVTIQFRSPDRQTDAGNTHPLIAPMIQYLKKHILMIYNAISKIKFLGKKVCSFYQ